MPLLARGAAFIDPSGAVLAADAGFLAALSLSAEDPAGDLRRRAASEPALRGLLDGVGPARIALQGRGAGLWLERSPGSGGLLLLARGARDGEWLEHAVRSQGLARLAGGLAHDIKNPLNAMALQLAILDEKLGEGDSGVASGAHLAALRDQIGKVNEVVRRFCDVADPAAPYGWLDLGAVAVDIVSLHVHEARRRRVQVQIEAPRGVARVGVAPERVVLLLLGLFGRAIGETPDGGALKVGVAGQGPEAVVSLAHATGDPDPDLGYYSEVAAAAATALGGSLEAASDGGQERITLRVPRNEHE
jgi:signal transduction histidine kinase